MESNDKSWLNEYPPFWDEYWLQRAVTDLYSRNLTPDERCHFARIISINAEAVRKVREERLEGKMEAKTESVEKALLGGKLSAEEIADYNAVSPDFVLAIQQKLREKTDN